MELVFLYFPQKAADITSGLSVNEECIHTFGTHPAYHFQDDHRLWLLSLSSN